MDLMEQEDAYEAAKKNLHLDPNVPLTRPECDLVIRRAVPSTATGAVSEWRIQVVDLVLQMLDLTQFAETKIGNAQVVAELYCQADG